MRIRPDESDSTALRFEIRDTGIGIPENKQADLFQPFTQADASVARRYGGTGLGLSIVEHLVELMGGHLGFESSPGKGSCFWFTAPLPQQPAVMRPPVLSLAGRRVLVVDDNASSRDLLMKLLQLWKCDAEAVAGPGEVLERLALGKPYDVLLVDLHMTPMRGDRLARLILDNPRWNHTPLVLMTPLADLERAGDWKQAGFSARVNKPVRQGELGACFASLMGYGPAPLLVSSSLPAEDRLPREQKSKYRLLLVEDNLVNQEVAIGILNRLGYYADVAGDGVAALNALNQADYDLVLMDCQMPEMDGYEASRLIRQAPTPVRNHSIPIVAMTAHAMAGDREKCLKAGMDDYLAKPIEPHLLDRTLEKWLASHEPQSWAPVPVEADRQDSAIFDQEGLRGRLMNDDLFAREVLKGFLATIPGQMAALVQAVNNADAAIARRTAHTIKGAAANVGGQALSETASRAEKLGEAGDLKSVAALLPELERQLERLNPKLVSFCERAKGGDPA